MTLVRVRLFAALRDLAGSSHVEAEGATVAELVDALSARYGERFERVARAGSIVVDGERADPSTKLAGVEEVALLPPVSGGGARSAGS
ncbi:MAG TPA: MoaD/ThiS family protein [Actinomycetota bacterium]|nr:MoaD/ThiS family protein [Actinomycetota bacterium]